MPSHDSLTNRASRIAARWDLTLGDALQLNTSRAVYKVDSAHGPAVLKLYQKLHCAGERAAIPFLTALPDDVALKIYRKSPLGRAVLMEWLDGPSLEDLQTTGEPIAAEEHLAHVAAKLAKVRFKNHWIYRKTSEVRTSAKFRSATLALSGDRKTLFAQVADVLDGLIETTKVETIIHGDFQFQHAILTPNGPRLFDPKGMRADPAAEYRTSLTQGHGTFTVDDFIDVVARRATLFAEATGINRQRMLQWATVNWAQRAMNIKKEEDAPDKAETNLKALLDLALS